MKPPWIFLLATQLLWGAPTTSVFWAVSVVTMVHMLLFSVDCRRLAHGYQILWQLSRVVSMWVCQDFWPMKYTDIVWLWTSRWITCLDKLFKTGLAVGQSCYFTKNFFINDFLVDIIVWITSAKNNVMFYCLAHWRGPHCFYLGKVSCMYMLCCFQRFLVVAKLNTLFGPRSTCTTLSVSHLTLSM